MKKKTVLWGGVAVLLLGGLTASVALQLVKKKREDGQKKPEVALVFTAHEVTRPTLGELPTSLTFSGPLVAPQTAVVRAKSSGTLLSLAVAEGARVKAGQALGRVDLSDLDFRLAERRAMVESARAQAAQAERSHASNQKLAEEKFISSNALEASRVAMDAARANARAAEAQLGTVRAAANLATLVAPIDGIVAKRQAIAGEKLSPEQPILTLVDVRQLELAGAVGTQDVLRLTVGMPLQVRVEGMDKALAGTLARMAPAAEAGTRSIQVAVSLGNPGEVLRAGQYAVATAVLPSEGKHLTVPQQAIVQVAGQAYVWVIEGGVLARRAVTTGLVDGAQGRIAVLRGVTAESQVLAMKFDNLREGRAASVGVVAPAAVGSAK